MSTKLHTRQSVNRTLLPQIASRSAFNTDGYNELDNLLSGINSEVTPAFRLSPNEPADLILNVGANSITNTETSVRHQNPPIRKLFPVFTGGTVTLPAGNSGNITFTPSVTSPIALGMSANGYKRALIEIDSIGNMYVTLGTEGATEALAGDPGVSSRFFQVGILVIQTIAGVVQNVTGARIIQFAGGGGSGGEGDTTAIIETLKNTGSDSVFALMGANVFATQEDDQIDPSSTAEFSVAKGQVVFTSIGEFLLSTNMASLEEFLAAEDNTLPLNKIDLYAFWDEDFVDTGATYEVSRNGGSNWQTVAMERVGSATDAYRGNLTLEQEYSTVFPVNLANTGVEVEMNASTTKKVAQEFTISALSNAYKVGFELRKQGTVTGSYRFAIYGDTAGLPDESNKVWVGSWNNASDLTTSLALTEADIFVLTNLAAAVYHVVLETDTTYQAGYSAGVNFIAVGRNNTAALNKADNYNGTVWSNQTYDYAAKVSTKQYVNDTLESQALDNTSSDLNVTTRQKLSQMFTVAADEKHQYRRLQMKIVKANGTTVGYYRLQVVKDDTNNPGRPSTALADVVAESASQSINSLSTGTNTVQVDFSWVLQSGDYHIVVSTDATYQARFTASGGTDKLSVRTQSGTTPDSRRYDGTNWANATGDGAFYFLTLGVNIDLRIRITSSQTLRQLAGFGVFYEEKTTGLPQSPDLPIQTVYVDGNANTTDFLIDGFTINTQLLKVYDSSGQVYTYGDFSVDGQTVKFDSGQFLAPGQIIKLKFDQTGGEVFDGSSTNSELLSRNHLGSTDARYDRSLPGRGLFLRRPDGTLRELTIDDSDNVVIYSV